MFGRLTNDRWRGPFHRLDIPSTEDGAIAYDKGQRTPQHDRKRTVRFNVIYP